MSKTPKTPSVPAPQFVIFDPPIPGFEARGEHRRVKKGDWVLDYDCIPFQFKRTQGPIDTVLTPVKRIEDLLPVCKVECWAAQDKEGDWYIYSQKPNTKTECWGGNGYSHSMADAGFNPFGLTVEPNSDWKSQLYHFTPAQGWKKVGGK